jgi:tetratricopeptide (TPR) repeat protein
VRLPAVLALAILGVSSTAGADRAGYYGEVRPKLDDDFWREVAEPHADEVSLVTGKINQALELVNSLAMQDVDADGKERTRLLDEARGMARYLRRLAPANPEVLLVLGKVADESGRADEALEALHAYLELEPEGGDAAFRVGRIYLRMRKYDEAVRYLRIATASSSSYMTNAPVYLAAALTATRRDDEAMDVLESAAERPGQWGGEPQLPAFALAVAYDRDEQISEAFEVIDRLQTTMQGGYAGQMQTLIDQLQPVPSAEVHYYRALLYESSGYLDEARTSWVLYANSGDDARFRKRALSHVAAIDVLIERAISARKPGKRGATPTSLGVGLNPLLPPPPPIRRKRHRRSP